MDVGLLILRVVVGGLFATHGAQKLFGWFGGHGLAGTGGFFESQLGFRPGKVHAGVAGLSEFGGGLLLALGLFTPLGAAAVVGTMIVAVVTVKRNVAFYEGGSELDVLYAASAAALAFTGPGRYSVDNAFGWSLSGWEYGLAAIGLGLVAAVLTLASREATKRAATPEAASLRPAA